MEKEILCQVKAKLKDIEPGKVRLNFYSSQTGKAEEKLFLLIQA